MASAASQKSLDFFLLEFIYSVLSSSVDTFVFSLFGLFFFFKIFSFASLISHNFCSFVLKVLQWAEEQVFGLGNF